MDNVSFGDRAKEVVAFDAARERGKGMEEIEAAKHLQKLLARIA